MTARQQRRQAERKALKAANKGQANQSFTAAPATPATAESLVAEPQLPRPEYAAIKRAEIIRANARNEATFPSEPKMQTGSTGPRTSAGKETSSQNAIRHGLAGHRFRIFDWESAEEYNALLANLVAEHQPATQTECLLVEKMAQHFWLAQRAITLQDTCFTENGAYCDQQEDLALYMRYGITHDRAFQKCLSEFLKLRASRAKEQSQFVSRQHRQAAEIRKQEHHVAKLAALKPKSQPEPTPATSETVHSQAPAVAFNSPQPQTLAA